MTASPLSALSAHQRTRLKLATAGTIGILGGSPGSGKTFVGSKFISCLLDSTGMDQICVMAPTGKAAVRMSENLQANGLPLRARTIHSVLGIGASPAGRSGLGDEFKHNERNPLPYAVFVLDEASMLDCDLCCSLFRALPKGAHVLLIGDVNQLPPVGHGAPLRDLIKAGLPYGELTEIKRQDGSRPNAIIEACASMRDRKMFRTVEWYSRDDESNLALWSSSTPESQISGLQDVLAQLQADGLDPVWDVQVLAAVNAKSPLSRKRLNLLLQDELNPTGKQIGTPFRKKDKVVCTKNGRYKLSTLRPEVGSGLGDDEISEEGKVFVANGEQGRVVDVQDGYLLVDLSSPKRRIVVPKGKADARGGSGGDAASGEDGQEGGESGESEATGTGCNFDLAYALSVHKSQGSEWSVAIVMLDDYPGARRVCCREWLYTAVSRAKKLCVLIGQEGTARGMVGRVAINKRRTLLAERIQKLAAEAL